MGIAADALRPFWMYGIHTVSGRATGGMADWVKARDYQVYTPVAVDKFDLSVGNKQPLLRAVAADVARLAGAAFESAHWVDELPSTPKACAWFLTRAYYSAYYAANAISRV